MGEMKVKLSGYDFEPAHAAMRRYVDCNILPGVSSAVLVGRDVVDMNCIGWADKEAQQPLRVDHIFRVFSNTKLITSCAALLLYEQGRFQLDDPIETYIPQLGNRRVLRPGATSPSDTEPARSSITIRQLLSHTAGLSYGLLDPGTVMFKAYNDRKVPDSGTTLAQMIDRLSELPLVYHPGTSWEYSIAIDVIARLVEVLSGQTFDEFLQSRIFDPLGMVDTGFFVPEERRDRLVALLRWDRPAGSDEAGAHSHRSRALSRCLSAPGTEAEWRGGPGFNSTGYGCLDPKPASGRSNIAQPDTIALMMTNQLPQGVWMRFQGEEELYGRGHGLAGGLIVEPS